MYSEDFVWREHIRSPEENFGKDNQSLTRHHIISVEDKLCSKDICIIGKRSQCYLHTAGKAHLSITLPHPFL